MTTGLNPQQIKELRDCFNIFDTDHSGNISTQELKGVVEALGIETDNTELKALMNLMDKDGSGSIDFSEFVTVMADQFYKEPTRRDIEDAFNCFDTDQSGFITEDELFTVMNKFRKVSKDDVKKMVKAVDKNNDGRISIKEFVDIMSA